MKITTSTTVHLYGSPTHGMKVPAPVKAVAFPHGAGVMRIGVDGIVSLYGEDSGAWITAAYQAARSER